MEQAKEYLDALNDATKHDNRQNLSSGTDTQLSAALYPLNGVWEFLEELKWEENREVKINAQICHPFSVLKRDNRGIYAQISALFIEACDGIPQILSHIKDQGCLTHGTVGMISELVQHKFKPKFILKRINASKPSKAPSIITQETVKPIRALLGAVTSLLQQNKYAASDNTTRDVLKSRVEFASNFLWFTADQCIEHEKMKDLFAHAVDVAYTAADLAFFNLHSTLKKDHASKFLERTSPFRPELRQLYLSLLISSKSVGSVTLCSCYLNWALERHVTELLSRKGSLKVAFGDSICWLERGLRSAYGYYKQINEEKVFKDLVSCNSHEKALAIEAGILIYSLFDGEMDNYHVLIPLLAKLNHVAVYMEVIDLVTEKWRPVTGPLKDLALYLKEELIFMRTFLMFSLEQCTEQTKLAEVLTLLQSLTTEAWSAIDSFQWKSDQESLALEISLVQFHLLFKFNFIKAVIRQICPAISASSEPAHPIIYLLNFLPASFEVIDSYFSELKTLKTSSSSGSPTMDDVLLGFHEYVLNLLLKAHLKFTDTDELKRFHRSLLVTILFYEDALDSNASRKVNFMLRLLTVTTKLCKFEDNLMDLLNHKAALEAQILDLVENALEELFFLREFLMDLLRQPRELDKFDAVLMLAEVAANKASLISIPSYESFTEGSSTSKVCDFLLEIESVKVALRQVCRQILDAQLCNTTLTDVEGLINFLLDHPDRVLERDAGSINYLKKQIPVIKEKLVLLSPFYADMVRHHNMHQELQDLVKRIQDAAAGKKYVFFFSIRGDRPAWYDMLYLSDVRHLLKFVQEQVRMLILKVPDPSSYSFPRTNGLGFLDCLLGKLEEMLCSNLDSIIDLKLQIGSVKDGLLCLRDQFADNYDEHGEIYGLVTSVTEMAYKVEFVIDSFIVNSYPLWYKVLLISKVIENIKLLNAVVNETCDKKEIGVIELKVAKTSTILGQSSSAITSRANEEMEGFQEATEKIKQQLLRGSPQLDVISIVGMAGVGKTTLAEKVFSDLIATHHFDVHAKCRVTQVYSHRELFLTILNDLLGHVDRTETDDGELADELRRFLFTKRFLILIDDVWDNDVWENLDMCFTGSPKGSRIILTTRLIDIANNVKCDSDPHHLRLFKDDESWTLLQDQVFQGESCPPELEDVGIRIAKSCGGLPLFIVLVAGVLKEKKKQADLWEEVEERLARQNLSSLEESMPIIGFSYKNLPDYLKPCFLYFGGLLKGKDIHVSKLTRLWMSEEFVQAPEDTAQYFLDDLISRNLVMVVKKRPNGKVKVCRIHDMLHQFCLEKAKQENLFLRINRFSGDDAFPENLEEYRLFVHSSQDQIDQWQPSRSNIRSLIFNAIALDSLSWPRDISFIFDSFKLVKVLDLESLNVGGTFPSEVDNLVHLRYLAVQTDANSIPSSIVKLWNLETFVVRGLGGEVILPSSILKMVKLRHILVKHRASFNLQESMDESLTNSQLDNLKTFSSPRLSYGKDSEKILRKMPNLRKLSCIFSGTFGNSEKVKGRCVLFPRLELLSHLDTLKLVSNSFPAKLQHVFNFPLSLRELTLSKFRLPWSQISTVGELPNLEILKLVLRAFEGEQWEVDDSEFPELKYLELNNLNIEQWSVSEDAFDKLEHLVLTKCEKLKEVPSQFGESGSLQSIDISWCSSSAANSAQEIQATQHDDYGRYTFSVTVQSSS